MKKVSDKNINVTSVGCCSIESGRPVDYGDQVIYEHKGSNEEVAELESMILELTDKYRVTYNELDSGNSEVRHITCLNKIQQVLGNFLVAQNGGATYDNC